MASILKLILKRKSRIIERSACQRTLSTYELLESILLYVEPPDLRNARLVSKYWNAVIFRSKDMHELWQTPLKRTIRLGRILLLGDGGTGKDCLVVRWILQHFLETYDPCFEDSYRKQTLIDREPWIFEFNTVNLCSDYLALVDAMIRDSDCYALVYSCSDRAAFDGLRGWQQRILSQPQSSSSPAQSKAKPAALVALIATKYDLQDNWQQVSGDEGRELARELGCVFYETSARTADGCDQAYDGLTRSCKTVLDGLPLLLPPIPSVLPQKKRSPASKIRVQRSEPSDAPSIQIQQNESSNAPKVTTKQKVFQRFKSMRAKRISESTTKTNNDESITLRHDDLMNHSNLSLSSLQTELLRISQT